MESNPPINPSIHTCASEMNWGNTNIPSPGIYQRYHCNSRNHYKFTVIMSVSLRIINWYQWLHLSKIMWYLVVFTILHGLVLAAIVPWVAPHCLDSLVSCWTSLSLEASWHHCTSWTRRLMIDDSIVLCDTAMDHNKTHHTNRSYKGF